LGTQNTFRTPGRPGRWTVRGVVRGEVGRVVGRPDGDELGGVPEADPSDDPLHAAQRLTTEAATQKSLQACGRRVD
jgi:hypothetical protein